MDDFEELKKNYLNLKEEHEIIIQELHECKRNLNIMESTQQDYKNEVDMLQSEETKQEQKYQEIIKQLEQHIKDERANHHEEKLTFEDIIMKMEEKNEKLKSELSVFKDSNTTHFRGDTSSLIQEILADPPEYFENQELQLKLQELTYANKVLEEKVQEYARELVNVKESYEYKRSELIEANENNTFLHDENMILKSELDLLKSQPLNKDSKGNSLFAEVNDRRVYLQDKINKMKSSYFSMSQEKTQLQNIVHHLKLENLRLLEKWKADISEIGEDEIEIQCSLRSRNKVLEKLNEQYARELAEKQWIVSKFGDKELEFFKTMLNNKNTEIKYLREELLNKALNQMSFAKDLTEARSEKRKWRLQAIAKQHELELFQRTEQPSSSDIKDEKTDTEEIEQNFPRREHRYASMVKERLSDVKEEHFTLRHSDGQLEETLNATVDNYLKQNRYLKYPQVPDSSFKSRASDLALKESNNYVDKENILVLNQSKKVGFTIDTVSPKKTARRNCKVISMPPVEL